MTTRARLGASARGSPRVPPQAASAILGVQDEGMLLVPFEPIINFTGGGVTATVDLLNNRYNVLIPVGAGGGWSDDGLVVRLTTVTDQVVVGALLPTAAVDAFEVVGSSRFTGNMVMNGDLDFTPLVDAQGELGTDALRWKRIRGAQVVAGDLGFDDPVCAVCQQEFQVSQPVMFKIHKIEGAVKLAVPVHDFCVHHEPK